MTIFNEKEFMNRYDQGQLAVNKGNWRIAYDCFMDCKGYLERYRPWDDDEISRMDRLAKMCNRNF